MNSSFITSLRKPPIYTKSMVEFWNDEYISEQMLKAHLDPEFDGASRKLDVIEKSVAWITEITPYYLWNTYFSKETLIQEAESIGFKMCGLFGDVAGRIYQPESDTIAVILEK